VKVFVHSVGLLGPGLQSWAGARAVLRGEQPHVSSKTKLQPPARLPAAERRRAGDAIKLAMAVADEAVATGEVDPHTLATVFTSSSGEGTNCHTICETLASADRSISPTRFTNSVHNAPSGYWHIAVASRAPSSSICAFDGSFAAGLVEAASTCLSLRAPVLLVASDTPYPEPLHATRPLADSFGMALVLTPQASARSIAALHIALVGVDTAQPLSLCNEDSLEFLRAHTPAAHALPLLHALAQGHGMHTLLIDYLPALRLRVDVSANAT
jgi:Beta-ketoacyl synthase, N-terminal domain